MRTLFLSLLLLATSLSAGSKSLNKPFQKDVVLLTIPKSGSHMMLKLFHLIYGVKQQEMHAVNCEQWYFPPKWTWSDAQFNDFFTGILRRNTLPWCHMNGSAFVGNYAEDHPDFKVVVMIRDLRDVCLSFAHFWSGLIDQDMGKETSLDEKLMWVITNGFGRQDLTVSDLILEASGVLDWMDHPSAEIFRFEEFVGPSGGGSIELQEAALDRFLSFLGLSLSGEERDFVTENLFGRFGRKSLDDKLTWTFRKGQIGGWKEAFNEEHKRVFKERLGDLLIQLGYENNFNW